MAFNLLLGVSLCWGVSAVVFNDTVGTMPDWRGEGVGQVPVVSGPTPSPLQSGIVPTVSLKNTAETPQHKETPNNKLKAIITEEGHPPIKCCLINLYVGCIFATKC